MSAAPRHAMPWTIDVIVRDWGGRFARGRGKHRVAS